MKRKILGLSFLAVATAATMFFVGTVGVAFGECASPMPGCQPAVKAVVHNAELTKFLNYFGLTWMQGPPNLPGLCHPPCDDVKKPVPKTDSNVKVAPSPSPKK